MRLHLHRWGAWGEPYPFGFKDYQRRRCSVCGKEETRCIGWSK